MTEDIITALAIFAAFVLLVLALRADLRRAHRSAVVERRDWPRRLQRDYEADRIRDNFFEHLTELDVTWLKGAGWEPPAEVARHWALVSNFRRIDLMTPAEKDALFKARAAGIHITAHPDDLVFSPGSGR